MKAYLDILSPQLKLETFPRINKEQMNLRRRVGNLGIVLQRLMPSQKELNNTAAIPPVQSTTGLPQ